MNQIIRLHIPCPNCGSSDAATEYDNGLKCFSCGYFVPRDNEKEFKPWRGVTRETMRFFGVYFQDERIHYPYSDKGEKVRLLSTKEFYSVGDMKTAPLFGMQKFNGGQAQSITITEGELDALSVYQMLGSKYPVVSVRSSVSARSDCEKARDYLNAFDRIYICFDNDNPGQKAAQEVAMLFDPNKVYHIKLDKYKDANEFLENNGEKEFVSIWWAAKRIRPKGVISSWDEVEAILRKKEAGSIATYPWPTLQEMTYGIRSKEVVLFTAQEKIGKTEVMRAIEYHLLKTTEENIGIIHLEEGERRAIDGLITYEVKAPVHLPDTAYTDDDKVQAFKALSKRSDRVHFYSHFGSDDPDVILDVVRALVVQCHCKFVFLDHITMVVTGTEGEDERKKLDYISTRLAMMTRELDFCLFLVSHVNDEGKTRGSRNISKVADLIISLTRDIKNPDSDIKNTMGVMVEGARYAGKSGAAQPLVFNPETYTLSEKIMEYEGVMI